MQNQKKLEFMQKVLVTLFVVTFIWLVFVCVPACFFLSYNEKAVPEQLVIEMTRVIFSTDAAGIGAYAIQNIFRAMFFGDKKIEIGNKNTDNGGI